MVCRKFSEKLATADRERAYTAGLLHDLGLIVNCMVFSKEFSAAMRRATQEQIAFDEAERATMGFTHCETGRALAEQWKLGDDIVQVIAHHHDIEHAESSHALVALVHLSDLLCRMRNLGYGYYERSKADLVFDPAWAMLLKEHRDLEGVDLARFTFELDEALEDIQLLVASIFGAAAAGA
jgi:HD-like signal output (HDOD) protein